MTQPSNLSALSDALADAVEAASPSIVAVDARRRFPASGIAWSEELVVTADHVIERDGAVKVIVHDGATREATIAGRDAAADVALLRVTGGGLAPFSRAEAARTGHIVLALGRPGHAAGLQASMGVVSSVGAAWRTAHGARVDGYLRSDTTFYPGFSGGPLVDAAGALVGMNTSRLGAGGITIPVAALEPLVEALLSGGRLKRGYLGISTQRVRLTGAIERAAGQDRGLLVVNVEAGSAAESAGMLVGDILVRLGEDQVTGMESLQAALGPEAVGKALTATVVRGGEMHAIAVTVGERS